MPGTSSLTVTHDVVQDVNVVCDLGVTLDSELSMQNHVNKVARTFFYHIRRLKQVQKVLRPDVIAELVTSLVFSRLDYCITVLAGFPRSTIAPLQRVQNAAARLVAHLGPRDHPSADMTSRPRLRSTSSQRYEQQHMHLKFGERSLSCAGPRAWNSLPSSLNELTDTSTFQRRIKLFFFNKHTNNGLRMHPLCLGLYCIVSAFNILLTRFITFKFFYFRPNRVNRWSMIL